MRIGEALVLDYEKDILMQEILQNIKVELPDIKDFQKELYINMKQTLDIDEIDEKQEDFDYC